MRQLIVFVATVWVVLYSNSRMLDYVPTYNVVHLVSIPPVVRTLELLLIAFLYVLSLATKMKRSIFIINICILVFLLMCVLNLVFSFNFSFEVIQEIYVRIAPLLFFIVVVQARPASQGELRFVAKFFGVVIALNVLLALVYQIPFYGYYEDNINGFFEDAHMFGNFLAVISIVFFYSFLKMKRYQHLFISIAALAISFYPRNEKVILLNVFLLGLMYFVYVMRYSNRFYKKLAFVTLIVFVIGGGFLYIRSIDTEQVWERATVLVNTIGVENIGPVLAWPMAFQTIITSPAYSLYGVGAGNYGWIAASRRVAEGRGSVFSNQFQLEFSNDNINNAGFLFRTNTWSSLLAEYGMVGFVAFMLAFALIIIGMKHEGNNHFERCLKVSVYSIFLLVIYQGLFTPYSNWSATVLMLPAMYLAAYFHHKTNLGSEQ